MLNSSIKQSKCSNYLIMKEIQRFIKSIVNFISNEVWQDNIDKMTKSKALLVRVLRVLILGIRGFNQDKIQLRASALTYYSLMSVVPVLAMAFGIAKGFGLEELLQKELGKLFEGQEDVLNQSLSFAHSMLESTKGGAIAGIGFILLLYTVMRLLENIEASFNDIWGIQKPRAYVRKFTDYLTIMLVSPIFVITASSVTVFISSHVKQLTDSLSILQLVGPVIYFFLKFLPYVLIWILFTFIYIIMPNTKVNLKSAFVAGLVAGTCYQLLQWGYINFQIGVSRYNTIYGSFAALPLFMIWLQLSWQIILIGAKISFANQNVDNYDFATDKIHLSHSLKQLIALDISCLIIKRFYVGEQAYNLTEIANEIGAPARTAQEIINDLKECRIIAELKSFEKETTYQPAQDTSRLTVGFILEAYNTLGDNNVELTKSSELTKLLEATGNFKELVMKSDKNILLRDL